MKKNVLFTAMLFSILVVPSLVLAVDTPIWYDVKFTGVDVWTYSAYNASQLRTDQTAPRRYRDWTQPAGSEVQATTYGLNGGVATAFDSTMPAGFAFDSINLWGKGGIDTSWGEKYVAVPDDANNGITSWKVIQSPTGWTSGIVLGNQWYNSGSGAYPVWRSSGTTDMLSQANMSDPNFVFEFQVLISNPSAAFGPDGKLKVWFGGFSDDVQMTGPNNYEVSGIMNLTAAPVPIPGALVLFGSGLLGLVGIGRKRLRK